MARATDDELRTPMEEFADARTKLAVLRTKKDQLKTQQLTIKNKLDEIDAEIIAQSRKVDTSRAKMKELLGKPDADV